MAKADRESSFWTALLHAGLYKRNQGRLIRQLTAGAAVAAVVLAAWTMSIHLLNGFDQSVEYGVPILLALAGIWAVYRLVNYPPFADFLMSPWARNWIFKTDRMAYMVSPPVQARWYEFNPVDNLLIGLPIALVIAFVSVRRGLSWGNWMARVQR